MEDDEWVSWGWDERGKPSEEVERREDAMGLLTPGPSQGVRDEAVWQDLHALQAEQRARETVWILGSGFSVGVGGPQLVGLLSSRDRAEMLAKFPALEPCKVVYEVFWEHQRDNSESRGLEVLWSHAEEFLEYVNTQA